MKFCKDCKHYSPIKYNETDGNCTAPQYGINLVTGNQNKQICSFERSYKDHANHCGVEAKFFEGI